MLVFVMVESMTVPVEVSFKIEVLPLAWTIVSTAFFSFDMIVTFSTAIRDMNGELIIDGRIIAEEYVWSRWFWLDLLCSFPFDTVARGEGSGARDVFRDMGAELRARAHHDHARGARRLQRGHQLHNK